MQELRLTSCIAEVKRKMPPPLSYRKPLYQLGPEMRRRIEQLPLCSRRTATHVLELMGQWCVDKASDGRLSEYDLRQLHDFSDWRHMQRYVSLFISAGLLIDLGQGDYVLEHFDDYHVPGWLQERRIHERRARCRARVRALRDRRSDRKRVKTGTCTSCNADRVDVSRSLPVTNPSAQQAAADPGVDPVSSQTEHYNESDNTFFARLAAIAAKEQPELETRSQPAAVAVSKGSSQPAAVARPVASSSSPSFTVQEPRARLPARMPRVQRPVHEGDVAEAVKALRLGPECLPDLHLRLAKLGATDADVGYAVRAVAHAPAKVICPDRYLVGVIKRQQLHRLAVAGLKSVGS